MPCRGPISRTFEMEAAANPKTGICLHLVKTREDNQVWLSTYPWKKIPERIHVQEFLVQDSPNPFDTVSQA